MITLPVMAWVFPPAAVGRLSMLQVTIQFGTLLFCLGMDQAYVREYHESDDRPALLLNAIVPGLGVGVAVSALTLVFAPRQFSVLLYGTPSLSFALITVACVMIAYVSRFLSLILRMEDRGLAFSMSQVLAKMLLLTTISVYALTFTRRNFLMLLGAQAGALALAMLIFGWNTRRQWRPALTAGIRRAHVTELFRFGWPLVIGGVASWALAAMDRIFLRTMANFDELAVYSVAASIASGATLVAGIFNVVWAPTAYKWHASNAAVGRVTRIGEIAAVLVCVLVCVVGALSWVLHLLLPASYRPVAALLPLCVTPPLLYTLSEVTGIGIAIQRRTSLSMVASTAAVVVNAALCTLLVAPLGALGAAIATGMAFWVFFLIRTRLSTSVWSNKFPIGLHILIAGTLFGAIAFARYSPGLGASGVIGWWGAGIVLSIVQRRRLIEVTRHGVRLFARDKAPA